MKLVSLIFLTFFLQGNAVDQHIFTVPGNNSKFSTTPIPEWVPDPSAGHYDCPDGWTAYARSEPMPYKIPGPVAAVYFPPKTDKKGHVLNDQPEKPICLAETKKP